MVWCCPSEISTHPEHSRSYCPKPSENDTIDWTFDRFGFCSSDNFKQSQLCGGTFPKQSVTCKWHFSMRTTTSMEITDMIFWIFGGGWRAPTFRRLMDSQVLSRKVCQNQPKDPPRNSPRLQRPDAWNILAHVPDNTPSNAHVGSGQRLKLSILGAPYLLCSTTWSCWDPKGVRNNFFIKWNQNTKIR